LDRPIVFLDTETATLLGAPHLLEIGAVRVVDGEAVDRFDTLVRPQVPIEAEATAIHGIPDDAVRDAPDAGEAIARFLSWLGDDWMADVLRGRGSLNGTLADECEQSRLPENASARLPKGRKAR